MSFNLRKELPSLVIVAFPFLYLYYIWDELPAKVPLHWNVKGEIDRWGDKEELFYIPILLPLLVYIIFLIIPLIDPKKQLDKMGRKYHSFKLILTLSMSMITLFILFTAKDSSLSSPNYIFIIIGVMFTLIGNFMKTIKPNYFIGIKTPWTLESEAVWKSTHLFAGKLWFIGGLVIVLQSLLLPNSIVPVVFVIITLIITFTPIIYSYVQFKKQK